MPPTPTRYRYLESVSVLRQSALAAALTDAFPVSPGRCLIVPRRHIASWFEATEDERKEMLRLLDHVRADIVNVHDPAGCNVGINDGPAAGQTVEHLHVHLIPRHNGDSPDPRGDIRWVLPGRADYWSGRK